MTKLLFAAALAVVVSTSAQAHHRHHHYRPVHHRTIDRLPAVASGGVISCDLYGCRGDQLKQASGHPIRQTRHITRHYGSISGVTFIPNPSGTWRIVNSCAHRLAAYWGLGGGLDSVSTWPQIFRRVSGPAVGVAAVRRDQHHVMGIIGGTEGAWRVADFNSGRHLNREYTVSEFRGYFFVDPRVRVASR